MSPCLRKSRSSGGLRHLPPISQTKVDFKTLVSRAGGTPVAYVSPGDTYISTRPGVPIKTDNPLDVAVQGAGWLALRTKAGIVVYTRDGRMQMQPGGELQSVNGYTVLDAGNGPIALDPLGGPATIAQDGMITQGSRPNCDSWTPPTTLLTSTKKNLLISTIS
jgi:flagellar basal-body rod protein FlgF